MKPFCNLSAEIRDPNQTSALFSRLGSEENLPRLVACEEAPLAARPGRDAKTNAYFSRLGRFISNNYVRILGEGSEKKARFRSLGEMRAVSTNEERSETKSGR